MKRWEDVRSKEKATNIKKLKRMKVVLGVIALIGFISITYPTSIVAESTQEQDGEKSTAYRIVDETVGRIFSFSNVFEGAK